MPDDLNFDDISEDLEEGTAARSRLNAEWSTLVALRDTIGIANKGDRNKNSTFRRALSWGRILIPELFDPEQSLLNRERLSHVARKYFQIAEASSEPGQRPISPIDIIEADISKYEKLLERESPLQDMSLIRRDLNEMRIAQQELRHGSKRA
ncbi:MAG: hypothetical protein WCD86_23640 [Ktedonobacteraceae bacterium]